MTKPWKGIPGGGEGAGADGRKVLDDIAAVGVDLADVFKVLEDEGVQKFIASWDSELVTAVEKAIASADN